MTTDATAQLIQRILNQLSQDNPSAAGVQDYENNLLQQLDNSIGVVANWAQIGSVALAAGNVSGGVGFIVVLGISEIMAALSALTDSGSTDQQTLQQLFTNIQDIQNVTISNYWANKIATIATLWSPLQADLDNISNEGFGQWKKGPSNADVTGNVNHFYNDALRFVNNLVPAENFVDGLGYWQRPNVQSLQFTAQYVVYGTEQSDLSGWSMGWYGKLPRPQLLNSTSDGTTYVADPKTMLPFLLLGIESYLTIAALVNQIDPGEPTFSEYLNDFKVNIANYASCLYNQYQTAVTGLEKSDIPSAPDVLRFFSYLSGGLLAGIMESTPGEWLNTGPKSPMAYSPDSPQTGYAWNGIYGVADQYAFYPAVSAGAPAGSAAFAVGVPSSGPSWIIDNINTDALVAIFEQDLIRYSFLKEATFVNWVYPWIQDRMILGTMARWKALYLFNGYVKVWEILQKLGNLPYQTPQPRVTLPDGTIANANWSARELCGVLNVSGSILNGVSNGSLLTGGMTGGYSLLSLVICLDNIARGSWVGPPGNVPPGNGLARPAGFRDRLTAAAVQI